MRLASFFGFALLVLSITSALAQVTVSIANDTPATKEQVQKLFEVMQIRQQTRLILDSMQQQMQAMTTETLKTRYPQITSAELARLNKISQEMVKNYPADEMLDDVVPVYQKYLTQTDVDAMIVFYSSPTGKKLMQQMPQMTQEAMQVSNQRMQKQIDTVLQRIEDMVKEEQQQKQPKGNIGQSPPVKPT